MAKMTTRFVSPEEKAERMKAAAVDKERQTLDLNPEEYIARHTLGGHAFQSHVANSPRSLLNNVLSGQKRGDTKFVNQETQTFCMQEILYNSMREIQDWVKTAKPGEKTIFAADFTDPDTGDPQYIGSGFVSTAKSKYAPYTGFNQVDYIESNIAAVVIKKNPNAPGDWEITTAFPMSHPTEDLQKPTTSIRKPNVNFKNLLHNTVTYQRATDIGKLALDMKCSDNRQNSQFNISYTKGYKNCPENIIISDTTSPSSPAIRITSDKSGLKFAMTQRGRSDVSLNKPAGIATARKEIPDLYQFVTDAIKENKQPTTQTEPARRRYNAEEIKLSEPKQEASGPDFA